MQPKYCAPCWDVCDVMEIWEKSQTRNSGEFEFYFFNPSHLTVFILYSFTVCLIKSLLILVFITLQIYLFDKVIGYFNKFACSFLITVRGCCEALVFFGYVSLYSCEYCTYFRDVTHFSAQPTVYDLVATCIWVEISVF